MKTGNAADGLASIIIPCWNRLEFTRHCIAALVRHTRKPWELIAVDNGSTDGTSHYLAGVQDAAAVLVTVIGNATNRGFPAAINQGLQVARGDYLVLLNNDVVVTDAWLDQLIALTNAGFRRGSGRAWEKHSDEVAADGLGGLDSTACPSPPLTPPPKGGDATSSQASGRNAGVAIGLAGPMSNYAAPPQLVAEVPYRDLDEMHEFARRWRDEHRGQWLTTPKLSGFCLLIKRAVYDAIGGLDERFGLGFFDDDDLAERARRAGFECAVARDLFVHHIGSRTFAGQGVDTQTLLDQNARRFADKWGLPQISGRRVALQPFPDRPRLDNKIDERERQHILPRIDADECGSEKSECKNIVHAQNSTFQNYDPPATSCISIPFLSDPRASALIRGENHSLVRSAARVSLTMIVRDEEGNLSHCLESARGLFDEIVVVDTGSRDRTREIAAEFGARVFDFAWIDDFAAARNAALSHATRDYAFWLDADDVIEPAEREKLAALLAGLDGAPGEMAAYVVRCACDPAPDGTGGDTVVDHIRLFPVRPDVRWTYRVHEQILPALRRAKVPVRWSDCTVRHTGYSDIALRARKLDRDARILGEELKVRPNDPFVLFNLGSIAIERRDWHRALEYLKRSLTRSAPTDSITCKLFALIARTHQMLGDSGSALRTCDEGLKHEPADAELWFRKGILHRHRGEPGAAEACWRRILTLERPEQFRSVDLGIYGHLTLRNLAALAEERGNHDEAKKLWTAVLAECPRDREARAKLTL